MSIVATDNKHYSDIADKIREKTGTDATYQPSEMPDGIDSVYCAGQKSMVDQNKLIPKTVSGSYISVDDVSEVPHNVACKISGVDNPEAVKVTRTGANLLFNKRGNVSKGGITWTVNDDGTLNINGTIGTAGAGSYDYYYFGKNGENEDAFTLPCNAIMNTNKHFLDSNNVIIARTSAGNKTINHTATNKSVIIPSGTRVYGICMRIYNTTIDETGVYVSLNLGTTALPYEPYNGQILTPAADGTVEGMTSVSPYMNIFTDNAGATLEATYRMSWGMQEERERFYHAFRQGVINHSISFEWLTLSKEGITSIINALSPSVTDKTVTFKKTAKEAAFTDDEWQELISTKPNWSFSLL